MTNWEDNNCAIFEYQNDIISKIHYATLCMLGRVMVTRNQFRNRWIRAVNPEDPDSEVEPVEGIYVSNLPWDPQPKPEK